MKVVLLAGGFGTRISEYTDVIPKPMIPIGGKPMLWHIMEGFARHGHKDFIIAAGYKAQIIKEYFLNYRSLNSDFSINLKNGDIEQIGGDEVNWKVTIIDTGELTMTGGRVKRLRDIVGDQPFLVTYGDGLSDVAINRLIKFHTEHGKIATVTAVRPQARFGELELEGDLVKSFQEKPQMQDGWINGGFFVFDPKIFDYIDGDDTLLEREPLENLARKGELMAYHHEGFWCCMDTKRDHEFLEKMWLSGAKWVG